MELKSDSIFAQAPSNIALIKYMGKESAIADSELNVPANPSLSLTLNQLRSFVEITPVSTFASVWIPELPRREWEKSPLVPHVPALGERGVARVLRHVERVRHEIGPLLSQFSIKPIERHGFEIRSANNFPASSGIASSASSFAALTLATACAHAQDASAFHRIFVGNIEFRRALSNLSRRGSGSSCRSFEGPWVLWDQQTGAAAISTQMPKLTDFVMVIGSGPKSVSSSEAHELVRTSPLWDGRSERASMRIRDLEAALGESDISTVARIAWAEMWEMHSLFHTCAEPFTYWEPGTLKALKWLAEFRRETTPPIVTMDAGANVHVLVPESHAEEWRGRFLQSFPGLEILEDTQGQGGSFS